jgi:hypothetical protein
MVWWQIVKPVTFMSSEILVALPFSLGEKVAGQSPPDEGTAPNASSPTWERAGVRTSEFGRRRLANGAKRNGG